MRRRSHEPPDLNEHRLHGKVPLPMTYARQLRQVHFPIARINAGQVDLGDESHLGRPIGVVWSAVDAEAVDTVLMDGLWSGLLVDLYACYGAYG